MSVNSKTVQGRRRLTFNSLDDIVVDAEKLAASPNTKMLGNWPVSQLFTHLAVTINGSIDGISARAPWYLRWLGPYVKGRVMRNGMSAGFKLPKEMESDLFPPAGSARDALEKLRMAIARTKKERMTSQHPFFGKLTHEEWTQLHQRHAELHLSFALPGQELVEKRG
ncbi:MAG TPA: DUF1569 domain-containing protein [Gemmataceae bacterium]|nr:DUF1569 domain-containing protein [Gemmataceae bacterium]